MVKRRIAKTRHMVSTTQVRVGLDKDQKLTHPIISSSGSSKTLLVKTNSKDTPHGLYQSGQVSIGPDKEQKLTDPIISTSDSSKTLMVKTNSKDTPHGLYRDRAGVHIQALEEVADSA